MIEPMKKVTVVALQDDQETTLKTLRDLEIIHIQIGDAESAEHNESIRRFEELQNVFYGISEFKSKDSVDPGNFAKMAPADLAEEAERLLHEVESKRQKLVELDREIMELAPWGNFRPERLEELRGKGIDVRLCSCSPTQIPELPDGVCRVDICSTKSNLFFAAVSQGAITAELPEVRMPERSLNQAQKEVKSTEAAIEKLAVTLSKVATQTEKLEQAILKRGEATDYFLARDSMGQKGRLEYVTGYIPANRKSEIVQMAYRRGWALMFEDPEEDDRNVPTLLRVPKWLNVTKPIFDFIGINPGYREYDVSACFLIFFTLFFAMIMGDAGYGAVFLGVTFVAKMLIRKPGAQSTINLFILLSLFTVVWGGVTGNWFGIIAQDGFFGGLDLFKGDIGQANTQKFCFGIALAHLSIAHAWRALTLLACKRPLPALGEIGWLSFVWGAFFVILEMVVRVELSDQMKTIYLVLLGAGFVLMLLFSVNWKDVGDILNFPFGALGGFVDSLSYIRLFAVGLSGLYVARAVNSMAGELMESGAVGLVFGIVIIFFGHILNMVLCAMGVLVHGIRLNTLEFSGHLGLEWTGTAFSPFRRRGRQAN